ncbi:hypothetical protein M5K25_026269 [Dendrobium thyrsiflorum]|uniref:Uncharacterized protein n=1 Tax=Dendrobium thyrsiflorum TaxID=117978 RepID=A0ABD0TX61_DENTH
MNRNTGFRGKSRIIRAGAAHLFIMSSSIFMKLLLAIAVWCIAYVAAAFVVLFRFFAGHGSTIMN